MPVNSTHPDYDANAFDWLRARDVLAGEDAVKSAGEKYLPRLDSQSDEEFQVLIVTPFADYLTTRGYRSTIGPV